MKYEIEEWLNGKCSVYVDGMPHYLDQGYWGKDLFDSVGEAKAWIDQHFASRPRRYEYTPKMARGNAK